MLQCLRGLVRILEVRVYGLAVAENGQGLGVLGFIRFRGFAVVADVVSALGLRHRAFSPETRGIELWGSRADVVYRIQG